MLIMLIHRQKKVGMDSALQPALTMCLLAHIFIQKGQALEFLDSL